MNDVLIRRKKDNPKYGMILIHGRGADAEDIMGIAEELDDNDILYAAPRAQSNTWYPYSFLAPVEDNEPFLTDSLNKLDNLLKDFNKEGISHNKIIIAGFSQGACLGLEYVYRNPRKYGGIAAFSGATISVQRENNKNSLDNTPVFLGCSERDPHIPAERVNISAWMFEDLGAEVLKKIYPGSFHGIVQDEIDEMIKIVQKMKQN